MKISKILLNQNESFTQFLSNPKIKDSLSSNGPRSEWASHVTIAKIQSELTGLSTAVTNDGVLTHDEIDLLYKWMDYRKRYLVTPELAIFKDILIDEKGGKYSDVFKNNLLKHLQKHAIGFHPKVIQGIYDEPETIFFDSMEFVLTGGFNHGQKSEIDNLILNRGGIVSPRMRRSTDYLIVGNEGSLDYKHGDYGGKIEYALESKKNYHPVLILQEEYFMEYISKEHKKNCKQSGE